MYSGLAGFINDHCHLLSGLMSGKSLTEQQHQLLRWVGGMQVINTTNNLLPYYYCYLS